MFYKNQTSKMSKALREREQDRAEVMQQED